MTLPRKIEKNGVYLLTRRCTERKFLLTPSKTVNQCYLYCLAYAARKTGVLLHAVCVMSTHHHLVVSDPNGRLPEFTACLHRLIANCIKRVYRKTENFWSNRQPSQVVLVGDEDVFDKMVYVLCNSVQAFLVDKSEKWPGVCTKASDVKGTVIPT